MRHPLETQLGSWRLASTRHTSGTELGSASYISSMLSAYTPDEPERKESDRDGLVDIARAATDDGE